MKKILTILTLSMSMHSGVSAQQNNVRPFIGITTSLGVGFDDFDTGIITSDGETVYLSTGGGTSIGVNGNVPLQNGLWCITGELNFQFTSLTPKLSNADGGFYHFNIIPGIRRMIPIGRGSNFLSAGAGAVFSMDPNLEVNASKIPGGLDYGFDYNNAAGAALNADFILWAPRQKLGAVFGLRYTYLKYHASKIKLSGVDYQINDTAHSILPDDMDKPDGSSIDLVLSLIYKL